MKVSGTATLNASREDVWTALNDPAVLVRTIPGCQRLDTVGVDAYRMTISAGVASIKGVYEGEVSLTDQQPHETFVLKAAGSGGPGTVSANVLVTLTDNGADSTTLTYDADAIVGGMLGGVGQRMLGGVAKKTAGEFFSAVDALLKEGSLTKRSPNERSPSMSSVAEPSETGGETMDTAAARKSDTTSGTYLAPQRMSTGQPNFASGVAAGAVAALAGALVGGLLARRRR